MRFLIVAAFLLGASQASTAFADTEEPPKPSSPGVSRLAAGGWALGGIGLAGLTTSAVTFWIHQETANDALACGQAGVAVPDFLLAEARCDLEALQSKLDGLEAANITAFSLGLAAFAAGTTMLVVDFLSPHESGVALSVSPGGGALRVEIW
ncbi:MAG: hypothetical protein HOV80_13960 [Polyangiaceae bacterium]|nr:hypothetical protein [Polyangiaceae bacterium]